MAGMGGGMAGAVPVGMAGHAVPVGMAGMAGAVPVGMAG